MIPFLEAVPELDRKLTVTGRVQSWLDNPERRLPVSCTVKVLQDQHIFGKDSVADAIVYASFGLRNGAGVAVHLSNLFNVLTPIENPGHLTLALAQDHPDAGALDTLSAPLSTAHLWTYRSRGERDVSELANGTILMDVQDSMEGQGGIEESWINALGMLAQGVDVCVDLSALRPAGATSEHGLVASGPVSFMRVYDSIARALVHGGIVNYAAIFSTLNETLRRGGTYKNGAVTLHLTHDHPSINTYINATRDRLPWVKRCIDVPDDMGDWIDGLSDAHLLEPLLEGIKRGDLWLMKRHFDRFGDEVYGNVCLEVRLKSGGTCLLMHVNLGACGISEMPAVIERGMERLLDLHPRTGVEKGGHYLPPSEDRQVGLGFLGLANQLAAEGISYAELADAFDRDRAGDPDMECRADQWVQAFTEGVHRASVLARNARMDRAFCIAPTASCSYRSTDSRGFACTPEIAPPIARWIDRDSGTFGVQSYDYPSDVEIASEVGYGTFRQVADGIVGILQESQLFHGYSLNSWSDMVTYDYQFLLDWATSPQTSLYYSLQVRPDSQAKDSALAAVDESYHSFFGFDTLDTSEEAAAPACDDNFCTACAE